MKVIDSPPFALVEVDNNLYKSTITRSHLVVWLGGVLISIEDEEDIKRLSGQASDRLLELIRKHFNKYYNTVEQVRKWLYTEKSKHSSFEEFYTSLSPPEKKLVAVDSLDHYIVTETPLAKLPYTILNQFLGTMAEFSLEFPIGERIEAIVTQMLKLERVLQTIQAALTLNTAAYLLYPGVVCSLRDAEEHLRRLTPMQCEASQTSTLTQTDTYLHAMEGVKSSLETARSTYWRLRHAFLDDFECWIGPQLLADKKVKRMLCQQVLRSK